MAFDLKKIDKKKLGVVFIAFLSGTVAVLLMNGYINTTVSEQSNSELVQEMAKRISQLEQNSQALYQSQQETARQLQQKIQSMAQQVPQAAAPVETAPRQSLALKTPPGKRAVTIQIQSLEAVGGLINPGDYVDILAHLDVPASSTKPENTNKTIVTLFQNIQVLAIGANVSMLSDFAQQQKAGSLPITLAVDPQQAELLTFAEKHGRLQLVLRGPEEDDSYRLESATWETFSKYLSETQGVKLRVPDSSTGEIPPPPRTKPAIEIIRGGTGSSTGGEEGQ